MKTYKPQHLPPIYLSTDSLPESAWRPQSDRSGFVEFAGTRVDLMNKPQRRALIHERSALREWATNTLDTAESEGRPLRDSERNALDATEGRMAEISSLLDELELARAERAERTAAPRVANAPANGPRFASMFGGGRLDTGGFDTLGDLLHGLQAGLWDNRYQALISIGDGNGTGLQIPEQFASELFDMSLEGEIVRPRARMEPMTSDSKRIAGFRVGSGGNPFGISGGWTAEGATIATSNPQTRAITLSAHKLAALIEVSNEAAADGTSLERQISAALARGLGWLLDSAFLAGTGSGQPLGILNAPATVSVAKEAGQAAATIVYENLVKMFARLHPASVGRSVWIANATTIPQLLTLGHLVGVGGAPVPVLRDDANGSWSMLTRPVLFTEKLPALGQKGDIILADLSQYAVGLRADIVLDKSAHVGFTKDTTYWRARLRADGQPIWDAPYTPDNGDPLSPFVTLAARP